MLKNINGQRKPLAAVEAVERYATRADVRVGMQGIFTIDG
jgi:hypothetical protein